MTDNAVREIIFDTETTGLGMTDRIISLGWIVRTISADGQSVTEDSHGHWLFDPEMEINVDAARVHGYSLEKLRELGAQPIGAKLPEIAEIFASVDRAVAHNASFDVGKINWEFERAKMTERLGADGSDQGPEIVDTLDMARKKLQHLSSHKLDALVEFFSVPARTSAQHDALEDCQILMRVYDRLKVYGNDTGLMGPRSTAKTNIWSDAHNIPVVVSEEAKANYQAHAAAHELWATI